jgi:hypothetical protein
MRRSLCLMAALLLGVPAFGASARAELAGGEITVRPGLAPSADKLPLAFASGFSLDKQGQPTIGITAFAEAERPEPSGERLSLSQPGKANLRAWTDHIPRSESPYGSFGSQVWRIKWEALAGLGYFTAVNSHKLFEETRPLHFKSEGWFGKSTENIGVDKLTHAFDSYILAEILHSRLHDKTGGVRGDALTAAVLATGLMFYSELYDGIEPDSGISFEDMTMNAAGAAFSVLRNTVPGLKEKLDFRLLLIPNSNFYTRAGKHHYAQQRYLMALTLAGFERFRDTPLRLVELHAGYYASDFTNEARAAGKTPRRHLFFGIGLNVRELFFRDPKSRVGRAAGTALDYFQIPYTAAHWD